MPDSDSLFAKLDKVVQRTKKEAPPAEEKDAQTGQRTKTERKNEEPRISAKLDVGYRVRDSVEFSIPELKPIDVDGASVNIVAVLIDDSGSMEEKRKDERLFQGIRNMEEELKKAIDIYGKNVYLLLVGFHGLYYQGNAAKFNANPVIGRICLRDMTPLTSQALNMTSRIADLVNLWQTKGINVHVSVLCMTDGGQNRGVSEENFQKVPKKYPEWRIWGMPIIDRDEFTEDQADSLFNAMGITERINTTAGGLAEAMRQFSQSASAY